MAVLNYEIIHVCFMATPRTESCNAAQSGPWHISSSFEALGRVSSGAKCASGRPQVKLCSTVISREGKSGLSWESGFYIHLKGRSMEQRAWKAVPVDF